MNEQSTYLVQAVRGPLMLITIGVLFAFDRFTDFRFSQTWPVVLIVAGILRLAGGPRRRYRGYPNPPAPPPPGAGFQNQPPHDHPMPDAPSPKYAESRYGNSSSPSAGPEGRQ
jgi:hypothetical protein